MADNYLVRTCAAAFCKPRWEAFLNVLPQVNVEVSVQSLFLNFLAIVLLSANVLKAKDAIAWMTFTEMLS
jgi:hypothetical protein